MNLTTEQTKIPKFCPEIDLLLCCARTRINQDIAEQIHSLLQQSINWDDLLKTAKAHKVMPLLYRSLKIAGSNEVPDEIMEKLRNTFLRNSIRNLYLTRELLKILARFEAQDILAIPFKGPVFTESVYGDVALRQFDDLDILVPINDIVKARNLLLATGYDAFLNMGNQRFEKFAQTNSATEFFRHDNKLCIDLHWELSNKYISAGFGSKKLKDRLETYSLAGKKVWNIPADELLFYLCHHGSRSRWPNLEMVCCVAEMVQSHEKIDWNRVYALAKDMRCERILNLGLFLAHGLLGARLPDLVMAKISDDSKIGRIASEVIKGLFNKNGNTSEISQFSDRIMFDLKVRNRISEKVRYGKIMLTRPKPQDWMLFPLPARLSFLHAILKPTRLLYKWTLTLIGNLVSHRVHREPGVS